MNHTNVAEMVFVYIDMICHVHTANITIMVIKIVMFAENYVAYITVVIIILICAFAKLFTAHITKVIFIAVGASRYYFTTYIAEVVRTVYTFAD